MPPELYQRVQEFLSRSPWRGIVLVLQIIAGVIVIFSVIASIVFPYKRRKVEEEFRIKSPEE